MAAGSWQPQLPNLLLQSQPHGKTHSLSPIPTSKFPVKGLCSAWGSSPVPVQLLWPDAAAGEGQVKGSLQATQMFQNVSTTQGPCYRSCGSWQDCSPPWGKANELRGSQGCDGLQLHRQAFFMHALTFKVRLKENWERFIFFFLICDNIPSKHKQLAFSTGDNDWVYSKELLLPPSHLAQLIWWLTSLNAYKWADWTNLVTEKHRSTF